jgi:hypothetical protein
MEDQPVPCLAPTNRSGFVLQKPNESGKGMGEKTEYSWTTKSYMIKNKQSKWQHVCYTFLLRTLFLILEVLKETILW